MKTAMGELWPNFCAVLMQKRLDKQKLSLKKSCTKLNLEKLIEEKHISDFELEAHYFTKMLGIICTQMIKNKRVKHEKK